MVPVPLYAMPPPLRYLAVYAVALQVSFRHANLEVFDLKAFLSVFIHVCANPSGWRSAWPCRLYLSGRWPHRVLPIHTL